MKQIFSIVFIFLSIGGFAQKKYKFKDAKILKHTPVKDQHRSSACWAFSTVSFIESELIRTGQPEMNLSEAHVVRSTYNQKWIWYMLRKGDATFSSGSLAHDVIDVWKRSGLRQEIQNEADWRRINGAENERYLKSILDSAIVKKGEEKKLQLKRVRSVLNSEYGTTDHPIDSFSINPEQYIEITSFTHSEYYKPFVLKIPDNYLGASYQNVPIDELMEILDSSLARGYTVSWDGDVSEKGFRATNGIAVLPQNEKGLKFLNEPVKEVTPSQKLRQIGFENKSTMDDHLMHIVGTVKDKNKKTYYVIKNSWGKIGPFSGYIYMSEPYMRMKTIALMVNKDVIPSDIKTRMNLD